MNEFHQVLLQNNNECEPAMGGKKNKDIKTLHGMIAELKGQVSQLSKNVSSGGNQSGSNGGSSKPKHKCFECGSEDHLVKDCPRKQSTGNDRNNNKRPPLEEWH